MTMSPRFISFAVSRTKCSTSSGISSVRSRRAGIITVCHPFVILTNSTDINPKRTISLSGPSTRRTSRIFWRPSFIPFMNSRRIVCAGKLERSTPSRISVAPSGRWKFPWPDVDGLRNSLRVRIDWTMERSLISSTAATSRIANGCWLWWLCSWIDWARTLLPVPGSPEMTTWESVNAIVWALSRMRWMDLLLPIKDFIWNPPLIVSETAWMSRK